MAFVAVSSFEYERLKASKSKELQPQKEREREREGGGRGAVTLCVEYSLLLLTFWGDQHKDL